MTKKKRKIQRQTPNTDTLELNMKQIIKGGYFPLITATSENERKHSSIPPEKEVK